MAASSSSADSGSLLANSEGLWWDNPLDTAEIEKSPFVAAFLEHFPDPRKR